MEASDNNFSNMESARRPRGVSDAASRWGAGRITGLVLLLLVGALTPVAILQKPRPDALRSRTQAFSPSFWIYPIERNAFLRQEKLAISGLFQITSNRLWAVTQKPGCILKSEDAGKTWVPSLALQTNILFSIHFFDSNSGYAVGDPVYVTTNGGNSWREVRLQTENDRRDSANSSLISNGLALAQAPQNVRENLADSQSAALDALALQLKRKVQFVTAEAGLALVGTELFVTEDGGQQWRPAFLGAPSGVRVKAASLARANKYFGQMSPAQNSATQNAPNPERASGDQPTAFSFSGTNSGWVFTKSGVVYQTGDFGRNWRRQSGPTLPGVLWAHTFPNGGAAAAVAMSGATFTIEDAAKEWIISDPIPGFNPFDLLLWDKLAFATPSLAWAISSTNNILASTNGCKTWTPQFVAPCALSFLHFSDPLHGFAAGGGFRVFRTADGGRKWEELNVRYTRLPAPWYLLSLMLAPVGLYLAIPKLPKSSEKSIVFTAFSDDPIESPAQDKLEFYPLADGLVRFLLNPATIPPLTVAITAQWGRGKSSLMRLMKRILQEQGARPVWFNAWHNQHEEQLFPALMANIIEQGVPGCWRLQHWVFRVRLFWLRLKERLPSTLALLLVFAFMAGVMTRHVDAQPQASLSDRILENLRSSLHSISVAGDLWRAAIDQESGTASKPGAVVSSRLEKAGRFGSGLAFLASAVLLGRSILSKLKAFNINPASLLAKAAPRFKISELEAKLSFQLRFGREFREVTEALGWRQMVIFIDDLDRCEPSKTLQMLEAINFVVSSGKCFVVLGLAKEQVEASLALAYKEIADEVELPQRELNAGRQTGSEEQKKRSAYARLYLKKLINMEIAVPSGDEEKLISVVTAENNRSTARAHIEKRERLRERLKLVVYPAAACLFLLLFLAVLMIGNSMPRRSRVGSVPERSLTQTQAATTNGTNEVAIGGTVFRESASTVSNRVSSLQEALHPMGQKPLPRSASLYLLGVPLAVLFALLWAVNKRVKGQFEDSPRFIKGLQFWGPELTARYETPRELKRYINRVRYIAMRQRSLRPLQTTLDIVFRFFERVFSPSGSGVKYEPEPIDEALLLECSIREEFRNGRVAVVGFDPLSPAIKSRCKEFESAVDLRGGSVAQEAAEQEYNRLSSEVPIPRPGSNTPQDTAEGK